MRHSSQKCLGFEVGPLQSMLISRYLSIGPRCGDGSEFLVSQKDGRPCCQMYMLCSCFFPVSEASNGSRALLAHDAVGY